MAGVRPAPDRGPASILLPPHPAYRRCSCRWERGGSFSSPWLHRRQPPPSQATTSRALGQRSRLFAMIENDLCRGHNYAGGGVNKLKPPPLSVITVPEDLLRLPSCMYDPPGRAVLSTCPSCARTPFPSAPSFCFRSAEGNPVRVCHRVRRDPQRMTMCSR